MYTDPRPYHCPYNANAPMYNTNNMYPCPYMAAAQSYYANMCNQLQMQMQNQNPRAIYPPTSNNPLILRDYGPNPFVIDITRATKQNNNFRLALWTGKHLQLTLMSINVGEDIGLEIHPDLDQFFRVEQGRGMVRMGDRKDNLNFQANVRDDFAFIVPAGKWHNVINTGNVPLKLYSIYAPPQHPFGTIHETKADAEAAH